MVELQSSNFRVITTNFLGVRIFRKFTVIESQMPVLHILGTNRKGQSGSKILGHAAYFSFFALS